MLVVEIYIGLGEFLPGHGDRIFTGRRIFDLLFAVVADPFYFLRKHGKVELSGIETSQVAVPEPFNDLIHDVEELGAAGQVFVLYPVDRGRSGRDRSLASLFIVPRFDPPCLHPLFPVGENLDEAQFGDTVRGNAQARALDVEEEQRPHKIELHYGNTGFMKSL